jgi:NAD(P)-dependent dehydrogenase (short-subunit alcohol dehydrogenase family)
MRVVSRDVTDGRTVALVMGGNRGIGREVARQLSGSGWSVIIGSRDREQGELGAAGVDPSGGHVRVCQLDVTNPDSVAGAAGWAGREFGRVDVVINNAAIDYDTDQLAIAADLDRVSRALDTNLLGAWRVSQAFIPLLRRSAHPRIVNVSSEAGAISEMTGGTPGYAVSKAALNALTRILAAELRADGVLVNAACPGWTDTDMGRGGRLVAAGAASVVWAAMLPDDGPTGGFFRDGRALPW